MNIKDGDYFSYSWKVGLGHSSDPYWCRDRRCVARESGLSLVLIDTYNYWPFKDGKEDTDIFTHDGLAREYSKYVNTELFDLEFICNLNDYEFVSEYTKDDYEGVVFVGYQCTKKWAKPKESEKSSVAVLEKLRRRLAVAEHQKAVAEYEIQWCNEQIEELGK